MSFKAKTIIVGVSGGIAAYKAAELVSALKKEGAEVLVAMTKSATKFVAPLTFHTLSQNPVLLNLFDEKKLNDPVPHISLAKKADLLVVVPATANIIAKAAVGIADDYLSTLFLSLTCPKIIAPAMNTRMWQNKTVETNLKQLEKMGIEIIKPESGRLACGEVGAGKLAKLSTIVTKIKKVLDLKNDFSGRKILIAAGGTREPIDPVRFIGNPSSGRMGYALAEAARSRGAIVTVVAGETQVAPPQGVEVMRVKTTDEMNQMVKCQFSSNDILIMAAAPADFKPSKNLSHKIKKNQDLKIEFRRTPDILKEISKIKKKQIVVGFAAETENLLKNGRQKLKDKRLDLIVINDVLREDAGFASETNVATLINKHNKVEKLHKMNKKELAHLILDRLASML